MVKTATECNDKCNANWECVQFKHDPRTSTCEQYRSTTCFLNKTISFKDVENKGSCECKSKADKIESYRLTASTTCALICISDEYCKSIVSDNEGTCETYSKDCGVCNEPIFDT